MASQSFHFHVLFHLVCNVMMTKTETNKESTTLTGTNPTITAALAVNRHKNLFCGDFGSL